MQFPHLNDTTFPTLRTVNVYQFQNTFDYTRWNENTKVTLCNVLWNSDYDDVVKFDTDSDRDTWFDSLSDVWVLELQTAARIVPEGYVKLPVPYDVMARYNYLFVDMPIATSPEAPLDYENSNGIRRWYFFIDSIQYLSPNATQTFVTPDVWTNFANDIDVTYMLLERGHAPVQASDTDAYLANPIANNRYLLAPDVTFDNAGITRSANYVPFGNGKKYVCLASTCAPSQITSMGLVAADSDYNPARNVTYSNVLARYGYQLEVHGLTLGNGRDYSGAATPAKCGTTNDGLIPNNLTVYAIEATECYGGTFLDDVQLMCPQFLNTLMACFVVDEGCITLSDSTYSIAGHNVRTCVGKRSTLLTKSLSKADFGYPQELQRFAKLYTSPYSQIEITDNDGTTYTINIEETSTITAKAIVSVAFPYIRERVLFEGIGGVGSTSYTWKRIDGTTDSLSMPNGDTYKYLFDWDIPTYALYMDAENAFMLNSFNRNVGQAIRQALVSYHNSMRSSNTAYENVCDQADTAYANTIYSAVTARDNAYRSATTGKANADNYADANYTIGVDTATTGKANADAAADTEKTNADNVADTNHTNAYNNAATTKGNANRSAATEKTNADNVADTGHTNAYNSADLAYNTVDRTCSTQAANLATANTTIQAIEDAGIVASDGITAVQNNLNLSNVNLGNQLLQYTTSTDVERSTATAQNAGNAAILSGALTGAQGGVIMGGMTGASLGSVTIPGIGTVGGTAIGALGGAVIGAIGGGITAYTNTTNVGLTTNSAQTITDAQALNNTTTNQASRTAATDTQRYQDDQRRFTYRTNANSSTTQMTLSNTTSRANAADARTTDKTNADNTQTTTKTNAANTKSTADSNAADTETTAKTNADNTQTTTKTNAANTKTTTNANAVRTYDLGVGNATTARNAAKAAALNTHDTSKDNADATYDVTEDNAERTRDNVKANAGYTRDVATLNAKELLENAADAAMAGILDARNGTPVQCGTYTGDPTADYMETRGFQLKVKTQSDSAIRQAGDFFARFGYALNQIWDVGTTGLKLMRNFTYWKATEVWVDDRSSTNDRVNNMIRAIFMRGVTVWNDPTKIGKVSVYDN